MTPTILILIFSLLSPVLLISYVTLTGPQLLILKVLFEVLLMKLEVLLTKIAKSMRLGLTGTHYLKVASKMGLSSGQEQESSLGL